MALCDEFARAGYADINVVTAAEVNKGNGQEGFSIFLIMGKK